jgi:hypothetical protein
LPHPTIQSVNLDLNRTKLICMNTTGLWTIVPGGDQANMTTADLGYGAATRVLTETAVNPALIQRSRDQTELIVHSLAQPIHWRIEIRWSG